MSILHFFVISFLNNPIKYIKLSFSDEEKTQNLAEFLDVQITQILKFPENFILIFGFKKPQIPEELNHRGRE